MGNVPNFFHITRHVGMLALLLRYLKIILLLKPLKVSFYLAAIRIMLAENIKQVEEK